MAVMKKQRELAADPRRLTRTNPWPTWPGIHGMPFGQYWLDCHEAVYCESIHLFAKRLDDLFGQVGRMNCLCVSVSGLYREEQPWEANFKSIRYYGLKYW